MPPEMWREVLAYIGADPELDFSKYVRRLIRADLSGGQKKGRAA